MGWQLFIYYKYWFMWTLFCFPMGFIGYWMKKDKWWGYLILLPMIVLTASSYAIQADFKKAGDTVLTIVSPNGEKTEYDLHIERDTYEYTKR